MTTQPGSPSGDAPETAPPSGRTDDAPPAAPAGPAALPGAEFFDRIRGLGIVRPDDGRWATGVCAGLARRTGLDPLLVRGAFAVVSLVGGFGLAAYGLCWLFLPHPDGRIHAQEVLRGVVTAGFVGGALAVLLNLPFDGVFSRDDSSWPFSPFNGGFSMLVLVGFGIWWFVTHGPGSSRNRPGPGPGGAPGHPVGDPEGDPVETASYGTTAYGATPYAATPPSYPEPSYPAAPSYPATGYEAGYGSTAVVAPTAVAVRQPAVKPVDLHAPSHLLTRATLGLALLAAAAVLLWSRLAGGLSAPAGLVAAAVALGVVAGGIVLAGIRGRRSGMLAPVAVLLALVALAGTSWHDTLTGSGQDQVWTPVTAADLRQKLDLPAGRAMLDLSNPALITGATTTAPIRAQVSLGAGRLVVIVPKGTEVDTHVGLGAIDDKAGGSGTIGGVGRSQIIKVGGPPVLVIDARVGVGQLEVVPAGTQVGA